MSRALDAARARIAELETPKKHVFWGAGEPDCPKHLKTPNGELHTFQCKVCGGSERTPACVHDENQAGRRRDLGVQTMERLCLGAYAREVEAVAAHNAMARHCADLEKRIADLEAYEPNWKTHSAQIKKIEQLEAREVQHLADIKALRAALKLARSWIFEGVPDAVSDLEAEEVIDEALANTAHYDVKGGEG